MNKSVITATAFPADKLHYRYTEFKISYDGFLTEPNP